MSPHDEVLRILAGHLVRPAPAGLTEPSVSGTATPQDDGGAGPARSTTNSTTGSTP